MILRNSIICNNCKDVIESKHRHDFVYCQCGKVSVDGGHDYRQISFDVRSNVIDNSIDDDGKHETRRKYLHWGKNYDVNMNALKKTEWVTIENMTTDHIKAILDGGYTKYNPFYEELFKEELNFRVNESV